MGKKIYTVLTAIDHDQKRYEIGTSIELNDEQAEPLYKVAAISAPIGDAEPEVPSDAKERLAAITTAIGQLDPNNGDAWLRDGKPDTAAISAFTGWTVSAAERNTAWLAINAQ